MSLLSRFSPFKINSNGIQEIEFLRAMSFETSKNDVPQTNNLVVVLVEDRLLHDLPNGAPSTSELIRHLQQFKEDLRVDGYSSWFIHAKVYNGPIHCDGSTLLAIREFFKAIKQVNTRFTGALLIGSFPEAMLVRRWLWRRKQNLTIDSTVHSNATILRIVPEIIAGRAEIVLADLVGNWQNIYQQGPLELESIEAIPETDVADNWPEGNSILMSSLFNRKKISFSDFFWINDSDYEIQNAPAGKLRIKIRSAMKHPELVSSQKRAPNPVAIPSIFVSRINARSIAAGPDPEFTDRNGRKFVDFRGKPRPVNADAVPDLSWHRDPVLERRLIIDYLSRNHRFRTGEFSSLPRRTAAITYPQRDFNVDSLNRYLKKASRSFINSVVRPHASLLDYINWLKEPAVFKAIIAHSSAWNTSFGTDYNSTQLEQSTGGKPWRWKRQGDTLRFFPSFEDQGSHANLFLHRTLWENKVLKNVGDNLLIHAGCQVNTPGSASSRPYSDPAYGSSQNAEGILFYLNSLAIMTRAKVYNDTQPKGFPETLAAQNKEAHFGGGWKAYYTKDSQNTGISSPSSKKRSYFWSLLGDWTLRLFYMKEDCVPINQNLLRIEKRNNLWLILSRSSHKALKTRPQAEKMLHIFKHYGFTQQCFVGRPKPSMEYYLVNGNAPSGSMPGEDAININPMECELKRHGNRWIIMDGRSSILSIPNWEEGLHALSIIRRHQFTKICFVDRPNPIMVYFRR